MKRTLLLAALVSLAACEIEVAEPETARPAYALTTPEAYDLAVNMLSQPRHPKGNRIDRGGSIAGYGRKRLIEVLTTYERWADLGVSPEDRERAFRGFNAYAEPFLTAGNEVRK